MTAAKTHTSAQIRREFIDFFVEKHGHRFVPSSPVVPHDDPTLLFANAGMNQFKPIFLGTETRDYNRAANSQKCIRAGGKHNDLDDVGKDTYHHTFFEMLGNWSFGDYFKAEAVQWAWELLTKQWGLDPTRLHATYFEGDAAEGLREDVEARELWLSLLPADRVHPGNKKDNFWEMGETGPCGPCSEIHYDRTPDKTGGPLVNGGVDQVIEIWNLVFIQFNRGTDGKLSPLPAKHVDTGMGFERICSILQGKGSNYDTDVFTPILARIGELSGRTYGGDMADAVDTAFRVIADHARMATFSVADGAVPSNKKRGAVLRSVIRRAVRYGYQKLELKRPFLFEIVPTIVEHFGEAFPELKKDPARIAQVIREEEADFLKTIERGLKMFEDAVEEATSRDAARIIAGKAAFDLHTTFGFPVDLTRQLAEERGMTVDMPEYERLFAEFQVVSGKGRKVAGDVAVDLTAVPATDDAAKYAPGETAAKVLAFVQGEQVQTAGRLAEDVPAMLLLDRTNFYAEQGGQVGDRGTVRTATGTFLVEDTQRRGGHVLHVGRVDEGYLEPNQPATCAVDARREDIVRHHTATHLLNFALREVLGGHVDQKGSLVDADRLRFDFAHNAPVSAAEQARVEEIVNALIRQDSTVQAVSMPLAEAQQIAGVRAVFGEKYPDPVRVVALGEGDVKSFDAARTSVEFCGGTHLSRSGEAGFFKIVSEEAVSKGVRRLTAVAGRHAVAYAQQQDATLRQLAQSLSVKPEELLQRVQSLQEQLKEARKKPKTDAPARTLDVDKLLAEAQDLGGTKVIVADAGGADADTLRGIADAVKKKADSYGLLLAGSDGETLTFVAAVSEDVIKRGLKAGDWVRQTATAAGGGGGGRPNLAQAGAKDVAKLPDALAAATEYARKTLG